jgi:hypothetical protein
MKFKQLEPTEQEKQIQLHHFQSRFPVPLKGNTAQILVTLESLSELFGASCEPELGLKPV